MSPPHPDVADSLPEGNTKSLPVPFWIAAASLCPDDHRIVWFEDLACDGGGRGQRFGMARQKRQLDSGGGLGEAAARLDVAPLFFLLGFVGLFANFSTFNILVKELVVFICDDSGCL